MLRRLDIILAVLLAALLSGGVLAAGRVLADQPPADPFGSGRFARDAFPTGAPPMPVCNAPREGVAACLAGIACQCRFERGGSITGRADGFRWDCGPLRPRCDTVPAAPFPPPTPTAPYPGAW